MCIVDGFPCIRESIGGEKNCSSVMKSKMRKTKQNKFKKKKMKWNERSFFNSSDFIVNGLETENLKIFPWKFMHKA